MVVISTVDFDQSTSDVINWLGNCHVHRINNDDIPFNFRNADINIEVNLVPSLKGIWLRKGDRKVISEPGLPEIFRSHMSAELYALTGLYYHKSKETNVLGSADFLFTNKLSVLRVFQDHNLTIPSTLVTTRKDALLNFCKLYKDVIIKPISDGTNFELPDGTYKIYAERIDDKFVSNLPDTFFPVLAQQFIYKKYEIRTFFLNNVCYSMAIFSSRKTEDADYRKSLQESPIRSVPYKLPQEIEGQITVMMQTLGLNTGSIDLIHSSNGEYVFLEINPSGQFGQVSYNCNYYLEKAIAEYLLS